MKIGSHNSFSYLPPSRWWMRPFAFMARCQRADLFLQILLGARLFDLRIRFRKNQLVICHGIMEYRADFNLNEILSMLNQYSEDSSDGPIYLRVVLELKKSDAQQELMFREFCQFWVDSFPCIRFFGGNNRSDWGCQHPIYRFYTPMPDLDDKYSSTTSLFPERFKLLRYIDDLWPWFYAHRYNHRNRQAGTTHDWLFIDFVDIE